MGRGSCSRDAAGWWLCAWLLGVAVWPVAGWAAEAGTAAEPHQIGVATGPIVVDGVLDEPAWQDALVVEIGVETFPADNLAAPVRTELRMTYDRDHLYLGYHAFDPDPASIRARVTDRDDAYQDDYVAISLDPFNDGRRAFEFVTNPIGVQMDMFYDDVLDREDDAWDALWHSAGRIVADGYVVEMAIPFYSLRFPKISGPQTWGFDGYRNYPRGQRYRFRTQRQDRNVSCYVCQFSKVSGFAGISAGRDLELAPTLTGRRTDQRAESGAGGLQPGDVDSELGLSVRWGLTPNWTLNGALNPDFSQVEADSAQLEVNNQFALFFPEKRPFFLEGADFFDTPLDIVNTRVVADPDWGFKLTGKQNGHGFGTFVARDTVTNFLLPGNQGSRQTSLNAESSAAVFRYRRDLGDTSSLGGLVTLREGEDGYFNRVFGFDSLLQLLPTDSLRVQALASETRYPGALASDFGLPRDELRDIAWRINYNRNSRRWSNYARVEDIGDDFRADLGFLPRVGYRFYLGGVQRIWWGGEDDFWTKILAGGDWDYTEDQEGHKLENEGEAWVEVNGPLESSLFLFYGERQRIFGGRVFHESYRSLSLSARPSRDFSFSMEYFTGDGVDFANVRPGEGDTLTMELSLNAGRHARLDYKYTGQTLYVQGGRLFRADLSELRLVYHLNPRTFVRLISQYLDLSRDPRLYPNGADAQAEDLFNQLLFSYKLNPRTVLFVGYADSFAGNEGLDLTRRDRTVFLKLGYAWVV